MKNIFRPGILALLLTCSIAATAQVPVLSSSPADTARVIFLDFDGHTVSGTSWNTGGPIVCEPSGLDNTKITEIFNRVAEDYRPFRINITTDPARYQMADANKRMRVILTVSSSWYGSAGGVAFVNSWSWGDDTPCFVFTQLLGFNVKNISEATAHEAGHTLGLYHQAKYDANCNKLSDYHTGVGDATEQIAWAPIMGVGYYRNFTLWNNGPNSFGCTSMQSDLDVITSKVPYRIDDHLNSFASATASNFVSNQFNISGVVERSTDIDMIRFIMPATGRFQLDAVPYNVGTGNAGSDLDMQVTLYNSAQTAISVYNPGTLLSSVIDSILTPGTYYLSIEGKGNLYAPAYASLGSYSLQGRFTAGGTLPLHKLELTGAVSGDKHRLNWEIVADEQITDLSIELSTDGRTFTTLTPTATADRSYIYRPYIGNAVQYRLNVSFDNGRQYYSNVVSLPGSRNGVRPQLVGNLISSNQITVSSPGKYIYQLHDMNGRTIAKGQLNSGINTINAGGLVNGMYIIRFTDGDQQWTDKIVRQ